MILSPPSFLSSPHLPPLPLSFPQSKPCEESPIVVVPSLVGVAHNYTKRKFVFRVATPHGSEYLLQVL